MVQRHKRIDFIIAWLAVEHTQRVVSISMSSCSKQLILTGLLSVHRGLIEAIVSDLFTVRHLVYQIVDFALC